VARKAVGWTRSNLGARRHRFVRVAVAGQAGPHAHEHLARNLLHALDFTVAGLAGDACPHVRAMVEVDVIRQGVDALPGDGLSLLERCGHALDLRLVGAGDGVAVHASLHRGHPGVARTFGTGVAIQAGDVVVARVQLVGKGNGLRRRITHRESIRLRGVADGQYRGKNRNGPEG